VDLQKRAMVKLLLLFSRAKKQKGIRANESGNERILHATALFMSRLDKRLHTGKGIGTFLGTEVARNLLLNLSNADAALRFIVVERHIKIGGEPANLISVAGRILFRHNFHLKQKFHHTIRPILAGALIHS